MEKLREDSAAAIEADKTCSGRHDHEAQDKDAVRSLEDVMGVRDQLPATETTLGRTAEITRVLAV